MYDNVNNIYEKSMRVISMSLRIGAVRHYSGEGREWEA
jgi:hypothetical protein